jgi:hypothetical protein
MSCNRARPLVAHLDEMELGQPVRAMNNLISAFSSLPLIRQAEAGVRACPVAALTLSTS